MSGFERNQWSRGREADCPVVRASGDSRGFRVDTAPGDVRVRSLPVAACLVGNFNFCLGFSRCVLESPRWKPGDRVWVDATPGDVRVRSLPLAACLVGFRNP